MIDDTDEDWLDVPKPYVDPDAEFLGRSATISGECVSVMPYKGGYRFEFLIDDGGQPAVVEVRVDRSVAPGREAYFRGRGVIGLLDIGAIARVEGLLRREHEDTEIYLSANQIQTTDAVGPVARAMREAVEDVIFEGGDPERLRAPEIHVHSAADVTLPELVGEITVLASPHTTGHADVLRALGPMAARRGVTIHEPPTSDFTGPAVAEHFAAALAAVPEATDLVLLVHGSSDWLSRRPFDDPRLALSVLDCPVPVFTAIGSSEDIALADRAARASFATASSMGNLLSVMLEDHPVRPRGSRFSVPNPFGLLRRKS